MKYKYLNDPADFIGPRGLLDASGAVILSIITVDNVLIVETVDPIPADLLVLFGECIEDTDALPATTEEVL